MAAGRGKARSRPLAVWEFDLIALARTSSAVLNR